MGTSALEIRVLGELEVLRDGDRLDLPQSKKTRALLAYLVLNPKPHRRDRLCTLFWDVTDDPRAALRWSLSKLRTLVNDGDTTRIVANRENVRFEPKGAYVDIDDLEIRSRAEPSPGDLASCAGIVRGELLEGMELPDFHDFQAWLVAKREDVRAVHKSMLWSLVEELRARPEEALPFARKVVEIDPLDERARATLLGLLAQSGRHSEAEQIYASGTRLAKELGEELTGELERTWRRILEVPNVALAETRRPVEVAEIDFFEAPTDLVGRTDECRAVFDALAKVERERRGRVVLLSGEPGVGKTSLMRELLRRAESVGGTVLEGRAFEAESNRPYGPWIDGLRRLSGAGAEVPAALSPLLEGAVAEDPTRTKERLFAAVDELVATRAAVAPPVVIALDDVHWLDDASTELLHYVARTNRDRPVLIALAARDGEIIDNDAAVRMLRLFRREGALSDVAVERLGLEATAQLAQRIAPGADPSRVFEESGGNPLFVIESARTHAHRRDDIPHTLSELVRDRLDRLPMEAIDLVRWGAVLGRGFEIDQLLEVTSTEADRLAELLEVLERHALVREDGPGYAFSHELVQRVVYGDISQPRRRLMHARVAQALDARVNDDETVANMIAHHAALAGDAARAARACLVAARRSLSLFASSEAHAVARRGARYAESVKEPERTSLLIRLLAVAIEARWPDDPDVPLAEFERFAEDALDRGCAEDARVAFYMMSYLRWQLGRHAAAAEITRKALMASQDLPVVGRLQALGESARCLVLLERDLPQAEALVLEAKALAERTNERESALLDAAGLLRLHRGSFAEARELLAESRAVSRRRGHRENEAESLAHLVMLEIQAECYPRALELAEELRRIAERLLREGSEAAVAEALVGLARLGSGDEAARASLESGLRALRTVDAKHRLAFALTRGAVVELSRGDHARAGAWAREALEIAELLERPSETCLALALLVAAGAGAPSELNGWAEALAAIDAMTVSADVRPHRAAALAAHAARTAN